MHVKYSDQFHPLYYSFLFPFPIFFTIFNRAHYCIFRHAHKVLQSFSPSYDLLFDASACCCSPPNGPPFTLMLFFFVVHFYLVLFNGSFRFDLLSAFSCTLSILYGVGFSSTWRMVCELYLGIVLHAVFVGRPEFLLSSESL